MSQPERTDNRHDGPEDVYEALERTKEQAERRLEAQIDSIGACDPREAADAECTAARVSAHRASAAAGVQSSNTPPSSSKLDEIDTWIGAEDWLEVCLYVQWNNWEDLNKRLKRAKEDAVVEGAPPDWNQIYFMGGAATVSPTGARMGGKNGPYFAYRLEYDELVVLIREQETPHKKIPSVIIRADGMACLYTGAQECYTKAIRMIEALDGTIARNRLSRVDICLDMPEVDIEPFDRAFLEDRYICRAVAKSRHSGTGTTVAIGKAPLLCRIYDKKAEVELKANPIKQLCMKVYRWNCRHMPSAATRVEFELHREALKDRGIDSVEDYYAKRADLVVYLTTQWLRFTANKVDRENKNQSKARTLPLWNKVRKAFKRWAGEPPGLPLEPLPKEKADVRNLIKQALGVAQAAAGFQGKEISDRNTLFEYLKQTAVDYGIRPKKRTSYKRNPLA